LNIFVGLYVLDIILIELGRALYVPLAITVVQTFLANLVYAAVLVLLVVLPMEPQTGADRPVNGHAHEPAPVTFWQPVWIKVPLLLTAIAVIAPSALGFVALGRFVAHQVVLSGTVLAACGLLYLAVRSATRGRADNRDMIGIQLEKRFGLVDPGFRRQLSRLVELLATLTIAAAAMPLLMLRWGFSGADIRDWFNALVFGFEIGQFRISLARILIGLALFTGLVFSTRLLQRWLRENVLAQQRVDAGIAHSIDTAVGYAGIALALLIALSYAGLDITSLAIVAGALSVGIGFGLQSIVNNFVSGLILLVERPIKVGDWIVVGTEQGNVRRISVRSTEIETFDRASLIVPNSELVTGRVLNWTHRNPLGRAVVKVFVTPTADPELVLELLRKCAEENPDAMKTPAPNVTFDNFNGVALEFTVRVVVSDVYMGLRVGTALRVAILQKLREAGLQMANPQQDVNLKDLEWVKAAAARISSDTQRAQSPAGSNDNA
jgi:small-conductance mechanosensitive channel